MSAVTDRNKNVSFLLVYVFLLQIFPYLLFGEPPSAGQVVRENLCNEAPYSSINSTENLILLQPKTVLAGHILCVSNFIYLVVYFPLRVIY